MPYSYAAGANVKIGLSKSFPSQDSPQIIACKATHFGTAACYSEEKDRTGLPHLIVSTVGVCAYTMYMAFGTVHGQYNIHY